MSENISEDENYLISNENLRASPELWPEKIPGSNNFEKTAHKNARENENGLTQDDIRMIYQLGNLPKTGVIMEIKRLYDEGYQLGVDESKEINRGKFLSIFTTAPQRKK